MTDDMRDRIEAAYKATFGEPLAEPIGDLYVSILRTLFWDDKDQGNLSKRLADLTICCLMCSFTWRNTPQGAEYWANVCRQVREEAANEEV